MGKFNRSEHSRKPEIPCIHAIKKAGHPKEHEGSQSKVAVRHWSLVLRFRGSFRPE